MRNNQKKLQKPVSYHRTTWTDRLVIEKLFNSGHSCRSIARSLCKAPSTISVEVRHGLYLHRDGHTWKDVKRYSAQIAQDHADWEATSKGTSIKLDKRHDYAKYVQDQVKQGKSPDQISGTLRKLGRWTVSTSTLYRYIDKGYIPGVTNKNLREKSKRKRSYNKVKAKRPPKGTSIERRPQEINDRSTFGHWELDSVIGKSRGKQESLLVLTERLTRYEIIFRVLSKTAQASVDALRKTIVHFPQGAFKTLTVDNGSEFQDCEGLEHDSNGNKQLTVYYCHPFSSCERGSNERNNRIIRRYLPKGKSLRDVTQSQCDRIADSINDMPRKILDYDTARERFEAELAKLRSESG